MKIFRILKIMGEGAIFFGCLLMWCCGGGDDSGGASTSPNSAVNQVPPINGILSSAAQNADDGMITAGGTLSTANKIAANDESPRLANASQEAATAANGIGGSSVDSSKPLGSSVPINSSANANGSLGGGGGSGSSLATGGGSLSGFGNVQTDPNVDPNSLIGPNGDGSFNAVELANGTNGGAGSYGAGKRGGAGGSAFGNGPGDSNEVTGAAHGNSIDEMKRDPASLAGGDGSNGDGTMGSHDPANYFSLLNPGDNLFKIVERRYTSTSRQWAISDVQQISQSTQVMIRK